MFSEEAWGVVLGRQRRDKGLGSDGWQGVLLNWAPEWMQRRFLLGTRRVAVTHDFPSKWLEHHIKMIPKQGRDPAVFSKNRDIWLSPHGWGIMTGCFRLEYERVQEWMAVPVSYSFRARRGAAAVVLIVRLITELAATTGGTLARCWVDLLGFFMGISRTFLYRMERATGVESRASRGRCARYSPGSRGGW